MFVEDPEPMSAPVWQVAHRTIEGAVAGGSNFRWYRRARLRQGHGPFRALLPSNAGPATAATHWRPPCDDHRRGVYPHGIVCRNAQRGATHTYDDWEYIWVGSRAGRRQLSSRRSQARGSIVVVLQEGLEHDHRHTEQTSRCSDCNQADAHQVGRPGSAIAVHHEQGNCRT